MKAIFTLAFLVVASNCDHLADPMAMPAMAGTKPDDMPSKPNSLARPSLMRMNGMMMDKGNDTLAAAASNEANTTCNCPFSYSPICASNGMTYSNECQFNCGKMANSNLTKMSEGPCAMMMNKDMTRSRREEACMCMANYMPVCGSDGQTYSNECMFNCAQKKMPGLTMKSGECKDSMTNSYNKTMMMTMNKPIRAAEDCMCTMENMPVCGSDGQTYSNACQLKCAQMKDSKLTMKMAGSCMMMMDDKNRTRRDDAICACAADYKPVCGSDGMTYSNKCKLMCMQEKDKKLMMKNEGTCADTPASMMMPMKDDKSGPQPAVLFNSARTQRDANAKSCICPQNYEPVCGSDGTTYSNDCGLTCAQAMNKNLTMSKKGMC